jgi:hypothetical protein
MVWYPAYLDKEDIAEWVQRQRPNFTTDNILNVDLRMTDTIIFRMLSDQRIYVNYTGTVSGSAVSPSDIDNFLWGASLCFNLEALGYPGDIHYSAGGIQKSKVGGVETTFMRMQPMFFLGQGDYSNLEKVKPFRTYKQLGEWFVNGYINRYRQNSQGTKITIPLVGADDSSRGYGWNKDTTFISGADILSSGLT